MKEFAVVSVPTLVVNVADGQIENVFASPELAQDYIESEKLKYPERRYGIREKLSHHQDAGAPC